ncbi:MAG: uncharacterized protein QG666_565, partial [Euryarchaeota archaeon]|nr:uncharacterized protein [Euryarchaeota archaeon]
MEGFIGMIGLERLGAWIIRNPAIIIAAAVLFTLFSFHYAQQVESQGMTTESFVSKDSSLYQLFDHLYQENFGVDGNIVLIEGDNVAKADVLSAELRLSDHMKQVAHVSSVQSIADVVADAEYQSSGVRRIPSQEKIDEILAVGGPSVEVLMPDSRHARIIVGMPTTATLNEVQREELLAEI